MPSPGRNDLCPCGSGKKFKHCCLTRPQAATGITPRDRTRAFELLLKYSRREQFDPIVAEAAREWADMPEASAPEALQAILQFETSTAAFFDWLFFDVPGAGGRTIADHFLATREWTAAGRAADYIRLMRATSLRLYQVRSVARGAGLHVRDQWTKDELFVTERLGSMQLVRWDVIAARIASHADGTHQVEGAVMALPPHAAKPLLKELKGEYRAFARRHPEAPLADFFKQAAPLLNDAWMSAVALQEPPTLVTAEGDPLTTSTTVFDVPAAGDALARLLRQPDFEAGSIGRAAWVEHAGERKRILGDVECRKGTLTLTTFSRARATRGRKRLEEILGPLAARREEHKAFEPGDGRMDDALPPETVDVGSIPELQSWLQEQDRQWLDTNVPALDGCTPREAARDRRLRARLRELLVEIENREARMAGAERDLAWMWKELGLRRP